jgi:hypothetical protein
MGAVFSNRQRTDTTPRVGNESTFAFLERVAGAFWDRVRSLIEDMVSRYCPSSVPDVVGRLQSGDDDQFHGAFWELVVHETLVRLGFRCHLPPFPLWDHYPSRLPRPGRRVLLLC